MRCGTVYIIVQKKLAAFIFSVGDGSRSFIRNVDVHLHDYLHSVQPRSPQTVPYLRIDESSAIERLVKVNSRLGATHGLISRKMELFIVTALRTSNPT
jgi:hypothetical protein